MSGHVGGPTSPGPVAVPAITLAAGILAACDGNVERAWQLLDDAANVLADAAAEVPRAVAGRCACGTVDSARTPVPTIAPGVAHRFDGRPCYVLEGAG